MPIPTPIRSQIVKVKSLILENYRGALQVDLHFCAPLTLLVGLNGAGKSSILDAVALMLSWAAYLRPARCL